MILNFRDWSDRVSIVTKTKEDNNVTKRADAVYIKNETKLLWPIEPGPVSNEGQIRQWRDRSYRSGLNQNWNSIVRTYLTEYNLWWKSDRTTTWPIVQVHSMLKNDIELLWWIGSGVNYNEN